MKTRINLYKLLLISSLSLISGCLLAQPNYPERGFVSTTPAKTWEEGLLSGNGTIGTNMFGNPLDETIIFTHERMFLPVHKAIIPPNQSDLLFEIRSLISKGCYKEATELQFQLSKQKIFKYPNPFVPVCDMNIKMDSKGTVKNYQRSVNFATGESIVYWEDNNNSYERRLFVSRADGIAVMKMTSHKKGGLNCDLRFNPRTLSKNLPATYIKESFEGIYRPIAKYIKDVHISDKDNFLSYSASFTKAYPGSIHSIEGIAYVQAKGGQQINNEFYQKITNANEILVFIDIDPIYKENFSKEVETKAKLSSIKYDYDELLKRHVKLHGALFNRVRIDFGDKKDAKLSTEELFKKSTNTNINKALLAKEFDAGRYNIISSTGELPPVLQGVWAGTFVPDWASVYTHNGNLPSAISSMLMGNMPELMLSYVSYIESLVPWLEINAKNYFGCRGIVLAPYSALDGLNNQLQGDFAGGFWTAGAAWASHYFYNYYLYTGDKTFLKEHALPFMEKAGLFYEDFLYLGPDGKYIFSPSQSPENTPSNTNSQGTFNATMDVAAAKQLFANLISASKTLNVNSDKIAKWKKMLSLMPDYMINEDGRFKEWLTPKLKNNDDHRHSSQLYPLYYNLPQEFLDNPALIEAVRNSVNYKLEKHWKGVSSGYMAFGLVQLGLVGSTIGDKEIVHKCLQHLANGFWLNNLASTHNHKALLNTDISGGMPAVMIKMLVYSDPGLIKLLPALPDFLNEGEIDGVLCRGQVEVKTLKWNESKAEVSLLSKIDQTLQVVCGSNKRTINLKAGQDYKFEINR